jgi:hypothetical protein
MSAPNSATRIAASMPSATTRLSALVSLTGAGQTRAHTSTRSCHVANHGGWNVVGEQRDDGLT